MITDNYSVSFLVHKMLSEKHGGDFTRVVEGNLHIFINLWKKQRQNLKKSATLFFFNLKSHSACVR